MFKDSANHQDKVQTDSHAKLSLRLPNIFTQSILWDTEISIAVRLCCLYRAPEIETETFQQIVYSLGIHNYNWRGLINKLTEATMDEIAPHANHTFSYIESEGPAHRPLDFPPPMVQRGIKVNALVVHPKTGQRDILPGVIHRESYTNATRKRSEPNPNISSSRGITAESSKSYDSSGKDISSNAISQSRRHRPNNEESIPSDNKSSASSSSRKRSKRKEFRAYFPQRRLQDAIYGSVWACLVLKRHYGPAADDAARAAGLLPGDPAAPIVWEIVGTHVAIKMVEWSRVHQSRGRLLEDPVKEIAAMQLIGTEHPNVLGSEEVLQDDDYLYSVMPYARGGDLFGYVVRDTELRGGDGGMSEPVARYWFKQILEVSFVFFCVERGLSSIFVV